MRHSEPQDASRNGNPAKSNQVKRVRFQCSGSEPIHKHSGRPPVHNKVIQKDARACPRATKQTAATFFQKTIERLDSQALPAGRVLYPCRLAGARWAINSLPTRPTPAEPPKSQSSPRFQVKYKARKSQKSSRTTKEAIQGKTLRRAAAARAVIDSPLKTTSGRATKAAKKKRFLARHPL